MSYTMHGRCILESWSLAGIIVINFNDGWGTHYRIAFDWSVTSCVVLCDVRHATAGVNNWLKL